MLRVGTEGVYAPFSYHDPARQLTGYDVDIARRSPTSWASRSSSSRPRGIPSSPRSRPTGSTSSPTRSPSRRTAGEVRPVGAVHLLRGGDRHPRRRQLDHLARRPEGQDDGETATSNWAQVASDAGAKVEAVEGFTQAITLLKQGRVDAIVNDSIAVYAYLAETGDNR